MNPGDIFNLLLLQPTINLVVLILRLLESLHISGAMGFAIIILTVIINSITWPFRSAQIKNARFTQTKMAELKPKLDELKKKHLSDKLAFSQAQSALFKEHGINPAAGCLPSLIPVVLIFPLYQTIFALFGGNQGLEKINHFLYFPVWHLNGLPNPSFFGLDLNIKPSQFNSHGIGLLLLPVLTGLLTLIQSKMMMPRAPQVIKKKDKEVQEDTMGAVQAQMSVMMPIMIGYFAYQFPVGLALYWNTLTLLGILQQYLITGWGGIEDWIAKLRAIR